mgnify:CR=1 FL=1
MGTVELWMVARREGADTLLIHIGMMAQYQISMGLEIEIPITDVITEPAFLAESILVSLVFPCRSNYTTRLTPMNADVRMRNSKIISRRLKF